MIAIAFAALLCLLWREISARGCTDLRLSKHVDVAEYPYHVSVRRNGRHACSGAHVHESWIITAASCVYDSSVPEIGVLLAGSSREDDDGTRPPSGPARALNVSKIVVPRTFDRSLLTNNIAMLKINLPFEPTTTRRLLPIFLPSSKNYRIKDGSLLVLSGWKNCKDGPAPGLESHQQPSATTVRLVNQRACVRSMPSHRAVSGKMLCASQARPEAKRGEEEEEEEDDGNDDDDDDDEEAGTCQDDAGAPLANGDVLVGILSWSGECGGGGGRGAGLPALYTRIGAFLPWITKVLALDASAR